MKYAYWLSTIPGIGAGKLLYLHERGYDANEIYGMSHSRLSSIEGLTQKDADAIEENKKCRNPDREWMELKIGRAHV